MGCFSFKCLKCGRGVKSSSFSGEKVHLFLLKDGKVIQKMSGEYDSYGTVFKDGTQDPNVKHKLRLSHQWGNPFPEIPLDAYEAERNKKGDTHWIWLRVCDLIHDHDNFYSGIAAVHEACFDGVEPTISSVGDPNQGWGDEDEDESYFGSTEGEGSEYKPSKPIPNYNPLVDHKIGRIVDKLHRLKYDLKFEESMLANGGKYKDIYQSKVDSMKDSISQLEKELKELKG